MADDEPAIPRLYKPTEAAKILRISYRALQLWIKKGVIKAIYLPTGRIRIPETEIRRILEEGGREDDSKN